MHKTLISGALIGAFMLSAAQAEPIQLKLSYFSSDSSRAYISTVKPFVDAVNAEGKGRLEIVPYFSGRISPVQTEQPDVVADGRADLAVVIPGYSPERFPDTAVMQLPGLFRDAPEATYVFRRLVDKGALSGFGDFVVIGAAMSPSEILNTRKKTASLADLKGQTIRVNNNVEGDTLRRLGATPVLLPFKTTMDSLAQGKIDGATSPPFMLFEFGIGRLTTEHYMIEVGGVPTALIMNRKKFESLPPQDQTLIRKFSGDWLDKQSATSALAFNKETLDQISADSHRAVVSPSPADEAESQRVFNEVTAEWAKARPRNQELLALAREEVANYRKAE
jgi:TRAP-type transport system periplasmic protein